MSGQDKWAKQDSQLTINISGIDLAEPELLLAALERIITFHQPRLANVFVSERDADGCAQYLTSTKFEGEGGMIVGILQRQPGAEIERHS